MAKQLPVLVIGGGLAGLFTALKLAPLPVTVIAGAPLGEGASSNWAQGGVAAAIGPGDSPGAHVIDTSKAGHGLVKRKMAEILAANASERILDLLAFGAPFDTGVAGALELGREAAHSTRRIVKVSGDKAGYAIMQALIRAAQAADHITLNDHMQALELAVSNDRVVGAWVCETGGTSPQFLPASQVVLATGGIGQIFAKTTNPTAIRGQGLAMAALAGAKIRDAEFVQFHPTALDVGVDPAPLASEALRGEGAVLINENGDRFMAEVHELADLAPRDVVARAVFAQLQDGHVPMLDCREHPGAKMPEHFATVTAYCREAGLDPLTDPVPVAPAAHFHMGGVATDECGHTSLPGLYACGEVAGSGVHGANRLAGNSLLEAVVFGARIAECIKEQGLSGEIAVPAPCRGTCNVPVLDDVRDIRKLMSKHVGVIRKEKGLRKAITRLLAQYEADPHGPMSRFLIVALLISVGAYLRKESRGGHFRADHPHAKKHWKRHSGTDWDTCMANARKIASGEL